MTPAIDYSELADIYDAYVKFDDDIPFFIEECREVKGPVLELMAGTGRVSVPLVEAGVKLTCVDYSEEMLDILRRKLSLRRLTADVVKQDVCDLNLSSSFDLAFMPFHSFAELLSDEEHRKALTSIHRCLSPAGRFICTLHNPIVRLRSVDSKLTEVGRFPLTGGDGEVLFKTRSEYDARSGIVEGEQVYEIFDKEGVKKEQRSVPIKFVLLEPEAFEKLGRESGFNIETVYGDYKRSPFNPEDSPVMVWSLIKGDRLVF